MEEPSALEQYAAAAEIDLHANFEGGGGHPNKPLVLLRGSHHRLAWVEADQRGNITVHGEAPDHWRVQLERILGHPLEGKKVLDELHAKLNGTALCASEPHEDASCPYRHGDRHLHATPVSDPPRVAARSVAGSTRDS